MVEETSNANSDKTSNELVWKIVESIISDWNVSSVVFICGCKSYCQRNWVRLIYAAPSLNANNISYILKLSFQHLCKMDQISIKLDSKRRNSARSLNKEGKVSRIWNGISDYWKLQFNKCWQNIQMNFSFFLTEYGIISIHKRGLTLFTKFETLPLLLRFSNKFWNI